MRNKNSVRLRPTSEDYLRAVGYLTFMGWAALFLLFPPVAYINALDFLTRLLWLGITFTGGGLALAGSVLRFDIKVEFPGLLLALVGPLFYAACQIYVIFIPVPGVGGPTNYHSHLSFVAYSALPGILLLPRTVSLYLEARRMKRLSTTNLKLKQELASAKRALREHGGATK